MRLSSRIRILSSATVAVTLLTACTGGGTGTSPESLSSTTAMENLQPNVPSTVQTWNKSQLGAGLIYAEQSYQGGPLTMRTFQEAAPHKLVKQFTVTGTNAYYEPLALDTKGDFYLTQWAGTVGINGVAVYKPGATSPFEVLDMSSVSYYPNGVAVDRVGLVAVPYDRGIGSTPSGVAFFAAGATTPCNVVQGANFSYLNGSAAFDGSGNLFVVGGPTNSTAVGEITGGCHAKTIKDLGLNLTGISYILDIQVDATGNLVILPQGTATLYIYPPGATNPSGTVPITDVPGGWHFSFNKSGTSLWMLVNRKVGQRWFLEYSYPTGGKHISSLPTTKAGSAVGVFPPVVAGTW